MKDLLTPKEAAEALGMSTTTISRCVKLGAPIHRWGTNGARYRIRPSEFVAWMESRGEPLAKNPTKYSAAIAGAEVNELARARRELLLGGEQ